MRVIGAFALAAAMLSPAAAPFVFEPAQADLFAAATLTNAWADYDLDGDPDLFVGFNGPPNRLYRNDKGVMVEVAGEAGVADARATRAAAWGDFDSDGDPDLLVGYAPGTDSVLRLYRNTGGRFTDVTFALGLSVATGAVRQPAFDRLRRGRRSRPVRRLPRSSERALPEPGRTLRRRCLESWTRRSAQERRRRVVRLRPGRRPRSLRRQPGRRCERPLPP